MIKPSLVLLLGAMALTSPALAQMKSGEQMKNYEDLFGVKINQHSYPYDITLMESRPAGNVLAPGEQPAFTFLLKNNLANPIHASARIDVMSYGTRGIPGDIWTPE